MHFLFWSTRILWKFINIIYLVNSILLYMCLSSHTGELFEPGTLIPSPDQLLCRHGYRRGCYSVRSRDLLESLDSVQTQSKHLNQTSQKLHFASLIKYHVSPDIVFLVVLDSNNI